MKEVKGRSKSPTNVITKKRGQFHSFGNEFELESRVETPTKNLVNLDLHFLFSDKHLNNEPKTYKEQTSSSNNRNHDYLHEQFTIYGNMLVKTLKKEHRKKWFRNDTIDIDEDFMMAMEKINFSKPGIANLRIDSNYFRSSKVNYFFIV